MSATTKLALRKSFASECAIAVMMAAGEAYAHGEPAAAQNEPELSIKATKLNETLTVLAGVGGFSGGNVLVSNGPDGMLMIDDKIPDLTEKLTSVLNQIGGVNTLKFVLNTHWHFDHTGANAKLGETAIIVAHENVRKRLAEPQRIDLFGMQFPAYAQTALPVVTYESSVSLHFNGEEIRLVYFPAGHTNSDSVVYFTKSNILHTGDLFFNGLLPFVDVQNGGDVENLIANIEKLIEEFPADAMIVPGHGPIATMVDLKNYHRMLIETSDAVARRIDSGESLEQIKAAGVAAEWESWTHPLVTPETWNAIIYDSLTK